MMEKDIPFVAGLMSGSVPRDRAWHELAGLSPMFQAVAARLLTARPDEREPIWADFLGRRPHPEWIDESPVPAQTARTVSTQRRFRLTCANDLEPRPVDWLWLGRVPLGMITMFAGDPKLGKSYVTLSMAAALSRGLPLPLSDRPDRPGSTILMSAEDDPARTIAPRLIASGADLTKVHILESVVLANGTEALPSLWADIDAITAAADRLGDCRLIVIDPVSAYLRGIDDNRNAALRGVLTPLNALAQRLGAAVVLVSHLTKTGSGNDKHRVLGSIAYVGACRANHRFVADPDDPTGRRVLMLDTGGNLAPPAPGLAYAIEDPGTGPRVVWSHEPVAAPVAQALNLSTGTVGRARTAGEDHECDGWLRAFLSHGHRLTVDVFKAARAAGFSQDQVRRAKYRIGAVATKDGYDRNARWLWKMSTVDPAARFVRRLQDEP